MKALVGVKKVVDYTAQKIKVKDNQVDLANTRMYINPFCEIAMQEAANLKKKNAISEITALSIGAKGDSKLLWGPLAMGADKAIYVNSPLRHDTDLQPLLVAKALKYYVQRDGIELVILGKQSVDDDCNQTGQLLAGMLGWPQATFASEVQINGKQITVTREVDTGLQTIKMTGPAVITCDLRLNIPKIAPLTMMMKAKKVKIEEADLADLKVGQSKVKILQASEPPKKKGGAKVADVNELLQKLQKEAKIF